MSAPNYQPHSLQDILPASTREAVSSAIVKNFKSELKLPKGMNRHVVAHAVDRVLLGKTIEAVKAELGLVASEVTYVGRVVDEFRAWNEAQKAQETTQDEAEANARLGIGKTPDEAIIASGDE